MFAGGIGLLIPAFVLDGVGRAKGREAAALEAQFATAGLFDVNVMLAVSPAPATDFQRRECRTGSRISPLFQHLANQLSGMNAFADHEFSGYQDVDDSDWRLDRIFVGCPVCHGVRIKDHQVGDLPDLYPTSVP